MKNRWSLHRSSWSENEYGCDVCRQNPARGFYHVYTYDLTEEEAEEDWIWSLQKDEMLALAQGALRVLKGEEAARTY